MRLQAIRVVCRPALFVAAVMLCAAHVAAQDMTPATGAPSDTIPANPYRVGALFGYTWFDKSSALDNAPFIGMRVSHGFGRMFNAGLNVAFSRPMTKGEFFPWNRQIYFSDASHLNDTTLLFQAEQRVTVATSTIDLGLVLGGDSPDGRGRSFGGAQISLNAGAGFWAIWLDPERTKGNNGHGGMAFPIGGGVGIPVGRATTLGLRIDDVIMTNFYRSMFDLSDPLLAEDLFVNPLVVPPPQKTPIHNMRLTLSFSFIPGVREQ